MNLPPRLQQENPPPFRKVPVRQQLTKGFWLVRSRRVWAAGQMLTKV